MKTKTLDVRQMTSSWGILHWQIQAYGGPDRDSDNSDSDVLPMTTIKGVPDRQAGIPSWSVARLDGVLIKFLYGFFLQLFRVSLVLYMVKTE